MVERPGKSSADQKIELLVFEKLCNPFRADFFTDAGVNDFDETMADRAANDVYAVPISARSVSEPAQEFRTLRRQRKCNPNACHVEQSETSLITSVRKVTYLRFFASLRMTEWLVKPSI